MKPTKRLTWLVGPPGAGKSTWAQTRAAEGLRVVEFNALLAPLIYPVSIRKGVLHAHGQLVQLIRELELHPDNLHLPPLLAVVGIAPEEVLFAGGEREEVWLLLPPRDRWERQLRERPLGHGSLRQYDDYAYSEQLYERLASWQATGRRVITLETPVYRPELIGTVCS